MDSKHKEGKRKGVFLVVVDETKEYMNAVQKASEFANAEDGYVALLYVMEQSFVQNWQNIEERIREEMRRSAEQHIWNASGMVIEQTQKKPMICIEEGDRSDLIVQTLENNPNIVALVLAASSNASKPGSLVSYFSGKGLARLKVPLMIVPSVEAQE